MKSFLLLTALQIPGLLLLHAQPRDLTVEPIRVSRRLALVIGNAAYPGEPLSNPLNDARAMTATLRRLGFETTPAENVGLRAMSRLIDEFTGRLEKGDLGLFYFAGHGVQVRFENFLVPVDFAPATEADIPYMAYSAARLRDKMEESGARVRVIILDACRNNPFRGSRGGGRGLAAMQTDVEGTLIAYATGDNNIADDNPRERNGLFTKHLVEALETPGLTHDDVFRQVKERVFLASGRRQNPFTYDNIVGQLVLSGGVAARTKPGDDAVALSHWNAIKGSRNRRVFEAYLKRFPEGPLAELAREQLQALPGEGPGQGGAPSLPQMETERQVDGEQQQARLLRQPPPVYPPLAQQARVKGRVRFYTVIGEDGKVAYLEVVEGHPLLIAAAMVAVKQWEYQPVTVGGVAVRVLTFVDVNFTLQ